MILDTIVVTNRIRALARDAGLSLKLVNEPAAYTDGSSVVLQKPDWSWDKEQLQVWEYLAYHEIGHDSPENKDAFLILKEENIDMETKFGQALNCLEDIKQEANQVGRYAGRDRVMGEGMRTLCNGHITEGVHGKVVDEDTEFVSTTFAYTYYKASETYPQMAGMYEDARRHLTPAVQEKVQILIDNDDKIDVIGETSRGVYDKAKVMLDLLGYDGNEEEQNAKDAKASKDAAEAAKKQLSEAAKEMAKAEAHKHTNESVKSRAEAAEGKPKKGKPTGAVGDEYSRTSVLKKGTYTPSDWSQMKIMDYTKNPSSKEPEFMMQEMYTQGKFLGTHVRKLLQAMSQTRYRHGLRRGKIGKNVHRVTVKDSGHYQEKIFKKKEQTISLDTSISLVIDCSGSMHGTRYRAAAASAAIMNDVLTQLRISHEIVGFTETYNSKRSSVLYHPIFKSYDGHTNSDQLLSNFEHFSRELEQNLDGESIMWAATRLLKRNTARKLMIVFSDGSPAAHRSGAHYITKKAIKELEARNDMEIYGIGIQDRSVKTYYTDYSVIQKTSELEKALLDVIKLKIINK